MNALNQRLIQQAQAGDLEAYSVLVSQFQGMAIGYGYAVLGDRTLAEDAAQEAFICAFHELPKLREPLAFPGWLRRLVFKQCDRLARGPQQKSLALDEAALPPAPSANPADLVARQDGQDNLLGLVRTLPERERCVIILFYFGGYAQTEMSAFLDVPLTTIKNRLYTARKRLKERMITMSNQPTMPWPTSNNKQGSVTQAEAFTAEIIQTLEQEGTQRLADYRAAPQTQAPALQAAIDQLSEAFRISGYNTETVWALIRALRYASDIDGIIAALKQYVEHAPNVDQAFLAWHNLVDHYALLRQDEAAVAAHQTMLNQLRGHIADERLLWSLADTTMLASWKRQQALPAWLSTSQALYATLPDTLETAQTRAEYLRTLTEAIHLPHGDYDQAERTCADWIVVVKRYADQLACARWMWVDAQGTRLSIYAAKGDDTRLKAQVAISQQAAFDYETWLKHHVSLAATPNESTSLAEHQELCQNALHNIGCQCLWHGFYNDAITLFERALAIQDEPTAHFFLAAAILQATNNHNQALHHFQQAIQNPAFSRRHDLQTAFREEAAFAPVWKDTRYLALIEVEIQTLVQQIEP